MRSEGAVSVARSCSPSLWLLSDYGTLGGWLVGRRG